MDIFKSPALRVMLIILLAINIISKNLGFALISNISSGIFSFLALIMVLPLVKSMYKKLLSVVLTITIVPFIALLYALFFQPTNNYWLIGSVVCFVASFPTSLIIIFFYKKHQP